MKNILITGGAGFIGSRLCEKLFEKGYNITILDNLSNQIHNMGNSILFNRIKDKCNFIKGDVRNKEDWISALKNQDIIVHMASETGTGQSMYELEKYNDVNIMGTSHMLDLLGNVDNNVKKIIIASSRAVYGEGKYFCKSHGEQYPSKRYKVDMHNNDYEPKCTECKYPLISLATDENSMINHTSIYGLNKYHQEQMVMIMSQSLKIDAVGLRYQNVFGPGQSLSNPYTGILSIFSTRILNGNDIDVYEDGFESRDFIYIEDAVDATILAIENENANGHVLNVGSGIATNINEVAKTLKNLYKSQINIEISGKSRIGDIRHNYADMLKIQTLLGFSPKYSFKKGISEFVSWVETQRIEIDKYDKSFEQLKLKGLI